MKFGTFYAYWVHDWHADYIAYAKKIRSLGFDIMEVSGDSLLTLPQGDLAELKAVSRDLGLTITSGLGPPKSKDVASSDPAVREAGIQFMTDIMQTLERIDCHALVGALYTYWPNTFDDLDKPAIWARGVESVKRLARVAEDTGVDYCLEVLNRFETPILNTCEEGVRFCNEVGHPRVKLLLDTFHMNIEEDNIPDAIRRAGSLLGHLHVGEGNRKVPGQGSLPWRDIGAALRDIGFDSSVVMEPFVMPGGQIGRDIRVWRDLIDDTSEARLDSDIAESLRFLKRAFLA